MEWMDYRSLLEIITVFFGLFGLVISVLVKAMDKWPRRLSIAILSITILSSVFALLERIAGFYHFSLFWWKTIHLGVILTSPLPSLFFFVYFLYYCNDDWKKDPLMYIMSVLTGSLIVVQVLVGYVFKIGFMVVPETDFDKMIYLYNSAINDYFDEHPERRPGRCLLGMDKDGLPILCNKHDHNCTDCPHRYEGLPRYKNLEDFIQFESFQDTKTDDDGNEVSLDVADPSQDTEGAALLAVLFDELMEYLQEKNPRYAEMVRLGKEGKSKAEIFAAVGLESSFGYKEWNRAKNLCEEFLAD